MKELIKKLNYKGQKRIAVTNAEDSFIVELSKELIDVTIDRKIDPRFPYGFIMLFVRNYAEVENFTPMAIHNLLANGIFWICFPKKTSKKFNSDIDRDHGWKTLKNSGFVAGRMVTIDEDWSAL
jgi:hypothetical protein